MSLTVPLKRAGVAFGLLGVVALLAFVSGCGKVEFDGARAFAFLEPQRFVGQLTNTTNAPIDIIGYADSPPKPHSFSSGRS